MGTTRQRVLEDLTAAEIEELRVMEQIEPFGERAMNLRFAVLLSVLVSMVSDKNKTKIADWLKYFEPGHEARQDSGQIMGIMRSVGVYRGPDQ